jgi:uracil-DNA glycosylase
VIAARDDALPDIAGDSLAAIAAEIAACTACELCRKRTRTVPGQGQTRPDILFVGEAPGHDEDLQGLAFVGRAGQLLTRMIEAMGYTRETVFIANINKCRPPDNRAPTPLEMATCMPFLKRQIALLQPKVIVALGNTALNGLIDVPKGMGITKLRGRWLRFAGIDLMPTFHPSYLLRNATQKRPAWEDLKAVLHRLGRPVPAVRGKS